MIKRKIMKLGGYV